MQAERAASQTSKGRRTNLTITKVSAGQWDGGPFQRNCCSLIWLSNLPAASTSHWSMGRGGAGRGGRGGRGGAGWSGAGQRVEGDSFTGSVGGDGEGTGDGHKWSSPVSPQCLHCCFSYSLLLPTPSSSLLLLLLPLCLSAPAFPPLPPSLPPFLSEILFLLGGTAAIKQRLWNLTAQEEAQLGT